MIRHQAWSDKCTDQSQLRRDESFLYAFQFNSLFLPPHPFSLNVPSELLIVLEAALEYSRSLCSSCFISVKSPSWLPSTLCLQFLGGPTINKWKLLVLGIVSVIPVYHSRLFVFSFTISPCTCDPLSPF